MKLLTIFRLIKNIPKTSWSSKKPLNIKPKIKTLKIKLKTFINHEK